jgi:hypothetical protein
MKHKLLVLVAGAMMALAPMTASAARVFIGGGFYGYGPGWYSPYWGPGYYYGFPNAGQVKLDTKVQTAQVFINGAYAGTTKENKTMHLRPGSYNIEIRENGTTPFTQQVYVASGKTLHLHPEL